MSRRATWGVLAAFLLVAAAYAIFFYEPQNSDAADSREVTWLLSHQPTDVFERAADVFADTLARESDGTLRLLVKSPSDVGVASGDVPHARVLELLETGAADIASVYTVPLGDSYADVRALNLPFLFHTYDEVNAALEQAALPILETLSGDIRGLAFTMSGGFMIIASKQGQIDSLDDMRGWRVAMSSGPVGEEMFRAFGAEPVSMRLETGDRPDPETIDAVETTYARLASIVDSDSAFTTYINETNHSVFLTAIIASGAFFDALTADEQRALTAAARAAAAIEREDSIALNARVKNELAAEGSVITELSSEARAAFESASAPVYAAFGATFTNGLVERLRPIR